MRICAKHGRWTGLDADDHALGHHLGLPFGHRRRPGRAAAALEVRIRAAALEVRGVARRKHGRAALAFTAREPVARSWATTQVAADDRARWGSPGIIIYFYRAGFILFSFERLLE